MKPDIENIIRLNGISIEPHQFEQLKEFANLLLDWNRKINLISRKDEQQIWTNHILLSLTFCFGFDFTEGARILDIGTGGGLPGIPLSIMFPATKFILVDSIRKKAVAVESMINVLGLKNATVICARAEELYPSSEFARVDSVIARSVSSITNLTSWSLPLLRTATMQTPLSLSSKPLLPISALITLKGGDVTEEINDAQRDHPGAVFEVMNLSFAGKELLLNQNKKFVVVRKKHL